MGAAVGTGVEGGWAVALVAASGEALIEATCAMAWSAEPELQAARMTAAKAVGKANRTTRFMALMKDPPCATSGYEGGAYSFLALLLLSTFRITPRLVM